MSRNIRTLFVPGPIPEVRIRVFADLYVVVRRIQQFSALSDADEVVLGVVHFPRGALRPDLRPEPELITPVHRVPWREARTRAEACATMLRGSIAAEAEAARRPLFGHAEDLGEAHAAWAKFDASLVSLEVTKSVDGEGEAFPIEVSNHPVPGGEGVASAGYGLLVLLHDDRQHLPQAFGRDIAVLRVPLSSAFGDRNATTVLAFAAALCALQWTEARGTNRRVLLSCADGFFRVRSAIVAGLAILLHGGGIERALDFADVVGGDAGRTTLKAVANILKDDVASHSRVKKAP